ncbi:hypothetical protein OEZ86_008766 [Tetradesmus obliquus]|nr:hypothetical protein OEZ86_008766 [Tetradesmus obliquus]
MVTVGDAASNHNSVNDCLVPPGKFYDAGALKPCPMGTYREGTLPYSQATSCSTCGAGISTLAAGSAHRQDCTVILAGYFAQWDAAGFAYNADECDFGSYWPGGQISGPTPCSSCGGYTTAAVASKSKSACAAPPGYYLPSSGASQMLLCPSSIAAATYGIDAAFGTFGTYRSGWATTPNGVKDCQICGANVLSEPTKENLHPADSTVELVAASPDACYITAGQSLTTDYSLASLSSSMLRAADCPPNTYGTSAHTNGLTTSFCKPCGRNMITEPFLTAAQRNEAAACINPEGFGVTGQVALQCSPGSWSARGSMLPCQTCAAGRTTTAVSLQQVAATDCFVSDGLGVFDQAGATAAAQWYDVGVAGMSAVQQAQLEVAECPVGRYSESQNLHSDTAARCVACPAGSATEEAGSTDISQCTVCTRGKGRTSSAYGQCDACLRGSFNDGQSTNPLDGNSRSSWECIVCPSKTFTYAAQVAFVSSSTTVSPGSTSADQCAPINVQLDASAGTSIFSGYVTPSESNGVTSHAATTLDGCVEACTQNEACHFAEFRYTDNSGDYTPGCFLFAPSTAGSPSDRAVYYKLPPTLDVSASSVQMASVQIAGLSAPHAASVSIAGLGNAAPTSSSSSSTVRAQSVSSGLYVKHSYAASTVLPFDSVTLQTASSRAATAAACDMSAACWGFVEVSAGSYALKSGNDLVGSHTVINAMKASEALSVASSRIVQP